MKELGKDERLLCELQGHIFEKSAGEYGTSSAVFVRRYMNSDYAARMDRLGFIDRPTDEQEAFASLDAQYGNSQYGSELYSPDELYWMGYIYRYWVCTYGISSKTVYKMSNVREMHSVYYAYHSLDPLQAIQRLMEAKGLSFQEDEQIATGVRVLRKIRSSESSHD